MGMLSHTYDKMAVFSHRHAGQTMAILTRNIITEFILSLRALILFYFIVDYVSEIYFSY